MSGSLPLHVSGLSWVQPIMCELEISWVGVSDDVLHVVGRKGAGACPSVDVSFILRDENGQTLLQDDEQATWLSDTVWQAKFPIEHGFRDRFCGRVQGGGEFRMPPYVVQARCQDCPNPAMYARELHCCPQFAIVSHRFEDACADPDGIGLLRRPIQIQWKIVRGSVAGDVHGHVRVKWSGGEWRGPPRVLASATLLNATDLDAIGDQHEVFTEIAFVPGGVEARIELEQDLPAPCADAGLPFIDVGRIPLCDCRGQPSHNGDFKVVGDNGEDLTQAVARGECVSARRVRISVPDDARNHRFEWLDGVTPAGDDPLSTDQAVPDTDEGITIRARIGSSPCGDEPRSVTVRRCRDRIGFCSFWRFPCHAVELAGVLSFYLCLVCMFAGLSCVMGGVSRGLVATQLGLIGKAASAGMSTLPEPVVSKLAALAAQLVSIYGELSVTIAAGLTSFGLGLIAASLAALCLAMMCLWYWIQCCAPRRWECRFLQNLHWCLIAFGTSTLWVAGVLAIVLVAFDVTLSTLLGIGAGAVFAYVIANVVPIVWLLLIGYRCKADWMPPIWKDHFHGGNSV